MTRTLDYLTVDEAAHFVGIHVRTAYAAIYRGDLPAVKVGRTWHLTADGVRAYAAERAASPDRRRHRTPVLDPTGE